MSNEKLYSNITNAKEAHFGEAAEASCVQKNGDIYVEKVPRVIIVKRGEREAKKEFLVIGYLLDSFGQKRESVILRDSADDIVEVPYLEFNSDFSLVKLLREGASPELIYLDGIPDKIVSGQQWVPKDGGASNPFDYAAKGSYVSDENPDTVWEVQSVVDGEVTLLMIRQEDDRESSSITSSRGTQTIKLTKKELVTKYRLHSHGFFLSNDFFKFIQNETYVAPENRDKIYMMGRGGRGEYVKMDDMVGPSQNSNHVKLDNL